MKKNTKTIVTYDGLLKKDDLYLSKYGGDMVRVLEVIKNDKGVWVANMKYIDTPMKEGLPLQVIVYDFERMVKWGNWSKLN